MEYDDRSRTGMLYHILGAVFGTNVMIEITTEHIPHDDAVMALQELNLAGFQFSVGWTKQVGLHLSGAMAYVVEIGNIFGRPTGKVVMGVISDSVAFVNDFLKDIGMFSDIVTYTKEGGFGIITFQHAQNPGGYFRDRTIIEGEENLLVVIRHFPDESW